MRYIHSEEMLLLIKKYLAWLRLPHDASATGEEAGLITGLKIYPSDNLAIDLGIGELHWTTTHSLANGTFYTGIPIKAGSTPVVATLKRVRVSFS